MNSPEGTNNFFGGSFDSLDRSNSFGSDFSWVRARRRQDQARKYANPDAPYIPGTHLPGDIPGYELAAGYERFDLADGPESLRDLSVILSTWTVTPSTLVDIRHRLQQIGNPNHVLALIFAQQQSAETVARSIEGRGLRYRTNEMQPDPVARYHEADERDMFHYSVWDPASRRQRKKYTPGLPGIPSYSALSAVVEGHHPDLVDPSENPRLIGFGGENVGERLSQASIDRVNEGPLSQTAFIAPDIFVRLMHARTSPSSEAEVVIFELFLRDRDLFLASELTATALEIYGLEEELARISYLSARRWKILEEIANISERYAWLLKARSQFDPHKQPLPLLPHKSTSK